MGQRQAKTQAEKQVSTPKASKHLLHATGLPGGDSRSLLRRKPFKKPLLMPPACPVVPSRSSLPRKPFKKSLLMPPACPVVPHARRYKAPYKKSLLMPPACPVVPSRSLLQGALQEILIDATGLSGGALTLVATPEAFQEILIDATGQAGGIPEEFCKAPG